MQIVIDVPDEKYDRLVYQDIISLRSYVENGIVLPKGHGRLIDANRLRSMYSINRANFNTVVGIQKWIDDAPIIVEADEVES